MIEKDNKAREAWKQRLEGQMEQAKDYVQTMHERYNSMEEEVQMLQTAASTIRDKKALKLNEAKMT